jgi:hypothetical protein
MLRRKFKKFWIFTITFVIVYLIYFWLKDQLFSTKLQNDGLNTNLLVQNNPIWEQLNTNVFFKRSSTFYVIERSVLRIYFLRRKLTPSYDYDFRIEVKLRNYDIHHIYLANATVKTLGGFDFYVWEYLSYKFDLLKHLNMDSYDDILKQDYIFHLYIINSNNTREKTLYPIDVNLKYIRSRPGKQKEGSIVCSKCFWLKQEDYQDLFWWIELYRQAGYKKVIFCNNSIPNTKEFNDLFDRNKDFVELSQLNFIPNFSNQLFPVTQSEIYINYYDQVSANFAVDCDTFNIMILNECFLNNTHKYLHVAVVDPDEIILPRDNSKVDTLKDNFDFVSQLKFDIDSKIPSNLINLELSCSNDLNTKLEDYLNCLNKKTSTFYFHMGFYLDDNHVRQILEGIEIYYKESKNLSQPHNITIIDLIPQSKNHNNYNFSFTIKNQDEINYALNLCKIYRNLIQVFEKSHEKYLSKYSNRFHRFFYIGGLLSSFANGKSFHSTDVTFDLSVHFPDPDKNYPDQAQLQWVGYDQGHISHFRHVNEFHKSSLKEVSITELILDLNYLNCYYKQVIEKFSKVKIF